MGGGTTKQNITKKRMSPLEEASRDFWRQRPGDSPDLRQEAARRAGRPTARTKAKTAPCSRRQAAMQTKGDVIIWLVQNFCSLKAEPRDSPCVVKMRGLQRIRLQKEVPRRVRVSRGPGEGTIAQEGTSAPIGQQLPALCCFVCIWALTHHHFII